MERVTTIQLERKLVEELKKSKRYGRQTYSELIREMLKTYKGKKSQYDEFLHRIQQERMTALWDNPEDEAWEHA